MTTDITELAQSLKAAAENAIGAHERLAAYPYGEIIDISQHEGEQIDIDITDLNEFNKEANPVNILALVEALEKAQRYIDELREWNAGLAQESFERQQRISELLEGKVGSALLERENHHVEVVGKLTEHITELESEVEKWKQEAETWEQVAEKQLATAIALESRTVKLPKFKMLEDYLSEVAVEERKAILLSVKMEFHRALNAEGIRWEAE
ncbi:Ead domain protein [Klebsiella pneumoniae]|uniref:ead/Ea22-like family protein n=1 Tax=Klebsiella pneumoniae TaxID=573 RepID=UPI0007CD2BCB|nr:ead/Ea22-like family protein [Klebsiella pneumoniae]SAT91398.1 Ead domain protein [Klebsiella pneumoniae]SAU02393.1 Ead domain protein [Klebsiella pneumoniae]SWM12340.1 Ead domain protein [Klebsiella pneumoniae]